MSNFNIESHYEGLIYDKPYDMRYRVHHPTEWPYCNIGIVKTPYIQGTGILISSNIVMTCAHLIYHTPIPSKIQFLQPKSPTKFTSYTINNYFIPKSFKIDDIQPNKNDWALLYINNNVEKPIKIKILEESQLKYPICLVGYPGDKNGELFEICGEIFEGFEQHYSYKLDTTTGQSGSPLFIRIEGLVYLVGLHQSSDILIEKSKGNVLNQYTDKNWGIRITKEIKKMIKYFDKSEKNEEIIRSFVIERRDLQKGIDGIISCY